MQREASEPLQIRKEATVGSHSRVTLGSLTSLICGTLAIHFKISYLEARYLIFLDEI